jgi:hypothetical protein
MVTFLNFAVKSMFFLQQQTLFSRMKKLIVLIAVVAAAAQYPSAQNTRPECGVSYEDQLQNMPRLRANLAAAEAGEVVRDRGVVQYVPIHFHRVGDNSGDGKVSYTRIFDQLCNLNEFYLSQDIQFYLEPHPTYGLFDNSLNNDNVFFTQTANFAMQSRRHDNAVNVFIVNDAVANNNNPGEAAAYYAYSPRDWVVARKDYISGSSTNSTLAHELGHFFSLPHPFMGWETSDGFGPGDAGWPIAPVISPDGQPTERVNGSNCSTAGDEICDTPPDYKFAFNISGCGNYNGGAKDPQGALVDPMENNVMSYWFDCTNYAFTAMQGDAIQADLASPSRNYLDNTFSPVSTSFTTLPGILVYPAQGEVLASPNQVSLQWQEQPGATHYFLEVDIAPIYSSNFYKNFIVTSTTQLVTGLSPNKTYYWRVRPFNQYYTCASPVQSLFKTGLLTGTEEEEATGLTSWEVAPNPVPSEAGFRLMVNASEFFDGSVALFNPAGQRVLFRESLSFSPGDNTVELSAAGLSEGIYYVVLENAGGRSVRKLAVIR